MLELGPGFTVGQAGDLNREWGVGSRGWKDGWMDGVDVHVTFDLGRWTIYEKSDNDQPVGSGLAGRVARMTRR